MADNVTLRTVDLGASSFEVFFDYVFRHNSESKLNPNDPWIRSCSSNERLLMNLVRLFNQCGVLATSLTNAELCEGLLYISGGDGFFSVPADPSVDLSLRKEFY
jgi:hypothetical protein